MAPPSSTSTSTPTSPRRAQLLRAARSFCAAFARHAPPADLVSRFFSRAAPDAEVLALEHGLPVLGRGGFLGRAFRGRAGARAYFDAVAACLRYENMRFGNDDGGDGDGGGGDEAYIVDEAAGRVAVRGEAEFTWIATGESWRETFVYLLAFDDGDGEGGRCGVVRYEVWADSGAAYLARKGELGRVRGEESGGDGGEGVGE
ncbi:hypothetical protein F5X99DRAFT_429237 [Biscogniauxia marginata]|nr:hypothetical protein F5X99DRAFT_429237 [Biscogniauxia marginata]